MSTADKVAAYETEVRSVIPTGLPNTIVYLPDGDVPSGVMARVEDGIGYVQGAAHYTVSRWIALHEFGHLYDMNNRARRDAFWAWRFGACNSAPKTWAEADKDARRGSTTIWMALPVECYAEAFAAAVAGVRERERTLDYGCPVDAMAARVFFGGAAPVVSVVGMVDLTGELPRANWSIGSYSPKTSVTVHWNGGAVPDNVADIDVIYGDAEYHMSKDWSGASGNQSGDGIMYHRLYGRDGTVYKTREDDAVLWHCGADGNVTSFAWQVMCGVGQLPTPSQLESLHRDLDEIGLPVLGHRDWSPTQCPGDALYAFINEEDDMFTEADRQMLQRLKDILEAREPLVWSARQQRFLDVETGKAFDPNKPPQDPRIKVT